ncbi:hypothetical protein GCM10023335_32290 [Streptomyces siamensis]|uniref:Transposase n=1 Tax=Streptomyces siamensis TaxID=1274986 RepID=A0ABP9IWS1_9ACTN
MNPKLRWMHLWRQALDRYRFHPPYTGVGPRRVVSPGPDPCAQRVKQRLRDDVGRRTGRATRPAVRRDGGRQRKVPCDTEPAIRRWKMTYTISTGTTVTTIAANSAP